MLKFEAQISHMGKRYIIHIPKALNLQLEPLLGKKLIVILEVKE
jgi:hypothetical protein